MVRDIVPDFINRNNVFESMDVHQNKIEKIFEKRLELIKYLEKHFPTELLQKYN